MKTLDPSWCDCATVCAGAKNTLDTAVASPTESGLLSRPKFGNVASSHVQSFGRDGQSGNTWRTAVSVFLTSRPPIDRKKSMCGFQSHTGAETMANIATSAADALRQILQEITPGTRPYSSDSFLPDHLVNAARRALSLHENEATQYAFNALSTAAWHCARGEPAKALSRLRRAQAHLTASMQGGAV